MSSYGSDGDTIQNIVIDMVIRKADWCTCDTLVHKDVLEIAYKRNVIVSSIKHLAFFTDQRQLCVNSICFPFVFLKLLGSDLRKESILQENRGMNDHVERDGKRRKKRHYIFLILLSSPSTKEGKKKLKQKKQKRII